VTVVRYDAPPTVGRFMESNARVRGIVGPFGSGKSSGCVMEFLKRAAQQAPWTDGIRRTRFCAVRNTYGQLNDTTRKTFEQWIPAELGHWGEEEFTFYIQRGDIECEVLFRALDRPQHVNKLLSLELTGAYINECREIPKAIFDGIQGRLGRYPSKAQGGASWRGLWFDSNPWHQRHWLHQLFKRNTPPQGFELYEQPSGLSPEAENVENLPDAYYADLCHGKDTEYIECYVHGRYPAQDVGSVFGALLEALEARGNVYDFERNGDEVFVSMDLGIADKLAMWWWRVGQNRWPEVLEYYENSGLPISHYLDEMEKRPCTYARVFLPHDGRARSLQTGISTIEQVNKRFPGKVSVTPGLSLADGLQAARWLLEKPIRFHATGCAQGLDVLRAYRYEFDEDAKVFGKKPVHDWASHGADAFRYLACAFKAAELNTRKPPPEVPGKQYAAPIGQGWNFQEIWEANMAAKRRVRR